MTTKDWKVFQKVYKALLEEAKMVQTDDTSLFVYIQNPDILGTVRRYFSQKDLVQEYPGKSYAVAMVYAAWISSWYDIAMRDVLNDPDLFMGDDQHFVPYDKDPETYEKIFKLLDQIPGWLSSGHGEQSSRYCFLECTEQGIRESLKMVLAGKAPV